MQWMQCKLSLTQTHQTWRRRSIANNMKWHDKGGCHFQGSVRKNSIACGWPFWQQPVPPALKTKLSPTWISKSENLSHELRSRSFYHTDYINKVLSINYYDSQSDLNGPTIMGRGTRHRDRCPLKRPALTWIPGSLTRPGHSTHYPDPCHDQDHHGLWAATPPTVRPCHIRPCPRSPGTRNDRVCKYITGPM